MTIFQVQLLREEINATRICSFLTELTKKIKRKSLDLNKSVWGIKLVIWNCGGTGVGMELWAQAQ